ncbi:MAG: DUF3748 domain-containing protein [Phycisphaerales bacterium]|jgi:hypothetical protein|nr:DUF3748 domain-containing protein [Phycisphaerales bacterium]
MELRSVYIVRVARRMIVAVAICALAMLTPGCFRGAIDPTLGGLEVQVTFDYKGHYLNHTNCFSSDDKWIVYDTRLGPGTIARSGVIEKVNIRTGEMMVVYRTPNQNEFGPGAGAAGWNPVNDRIVFTRGLLGSNSLKPYGPWRRGGVIVDASDPTKAIHADGRDITPRFTPGALRGGTYGHTWSGDGKWISFTYHDMVLGMLGKAQRKRLDLRTIGVMAPIRAVKVDRDAEGENIDGEMFSVLAVRVNGDMKRQGDEIDRAYNPSWVGVNGYVKPDGSRQKRALAFQGIVLNDESESVAEVFIVDLPDRIDTPGDHGPLQGTPTMRPMPPKGAAQRRLTDNTKRKYPGIQGPLHWLKSSADGKWIAYLAKDDNGASQIHLVSPNGGKSIQLTNNKWALDSPFDWSPGGRYIAYAMDNSIFVTDTKPGETFGRTTRITERTDDDRKPESHAVVWSNRGDMIAFSRRIKHADIRWPQIFIVKLRRK